MEESTNVTESPMVAPGPSGALAVKNLRTDLLPKHERARIRRHKEAQKAYGRGEKVNIKGVKDKKLRGNLSKLEKKFKEHAIKAKDAEILHENAPGYLEPETELEKTYSVRQDDICRSVAIEAAQKRLDLELHSLGPYVFDYTRNSGHLLLGGRRGHIATMDWREGKLVCEMQLGETVRDVRWLHNREYFAVAQKKYTYIYDHNGVELHCLQKHMEVTHMEFLPYHFLLATLASTGWLKYQDVSTGQIAAEMPTRLGPPVSVAMNPWNAILHIGHQNGTVTLWSPNSQEPLVKLLAHKGPVRSVAIDREGRYMVSTGQDLKMAVWDIRMYREVKKLYTRAPGSSVAVSDTGLAAVGWGTSTTIWKDLFSSHEDVKDPYMAWGGEGKRIERVRWCPFEDVLGLGHDKGFSSILVPGSGESNFDALEVNPYETTKQRQEAEVRSLLNKLQPETIALDPTFIGTLDLRSQKQRQADRDPEGAAAGTLDVVRNRARGGKGALKKYLRKQRKRNIIDEKRLRVEEAWKAHKAKTEKRKKDTDADLGPVLSRFSKNE